MRASLEAWGRVTAAILLGASLLTVSAAAGPGGSLGTATDDPGIRVDRGASVEAVTFPDGSVALYVTRPCPGSTAVPDICLYLSTDGLSFSHKPITGLPRGAHDPAVVILADRRMRMYFMGQRQPGQGPAGQNVLSAVSRDGITWSSEPGVRLADPAHAGVPEVIVLPDGSYRMFYSAEDRRQAPYTFVKSATSRDGLTFTVDQGQRTPAYFSGPGIVEAQPGVWIMTVARVHPEHPHNQLFLASSQDTLTWTMASDPLLQRSDGNTFDPDLLVLGDGRLRLYYSFVPGCLGLGHNLSCGRAGTEVVVSASVRR